VEREPVPEVPNDEADNWLENMVDLDKQAPFTDTDEGQDDEDA
jgi:hypothetical protein